MDWAYLLAAGLSAEHCPPFSADSSSNVLNANSALDTQTGESDEVCLARYGIDPTRQLRICLDLTGARRPPK